MKKIAILLALAPVIAYAHDISSNIDIVQLNSMSFSPELKNEMRAYNSDMKNKGYIEKDNAYIHQLLKIKTASNARSTQLGSNELKDSESDIKITFKFTSVLPNPVAYSGIGIETNTGTWSGIKEFFDGKEAGMCSLSVFDISKVKEHIQLNAEGLGYEVNDKPTRITVEGNINSGFMYSIRWYDKNFAREIECANNDMKESIKTKMLEFAKKVDIS